MTATLLFVITFACTVCDSETGQQVRTGIFSESFWPTLLAVVSPFPVLIAAVAALPWRLSPTYPSTEKQKP